MIILEFFIGFVFSVLLLNALYILFLSVAGLFYKKTFTLPSVKKGRFAILIPAYQYDDLILESATEALKQNYPKELFDVFAITDHIKPETIQTLQQLKVNVINVSFEKSTKAKALNFAFSKIDENLYDYALILDIDNLMEPLLLEKLNTFHEKGFIAIQAHRTTKNTNTNFAVLDAISEEINNHVHRKAHRVLNLASILIGSGMSFKYSYIKNLMFNVESSVEDKEIEMAILKDENDIAYIDDALVYDEKVAKSEVFANQRIRWVYSQLFALKLHFKDGMLSLLKGNISYFIKVVELMLIPKVMLVGFLGILLVITLLTGFYTYALLTAITFFFYVVALLIAVPGNYYNTNTLSAVLSIPKAFVLMTLTLFKLDKAKKSFIPTHHEKS